MLDLKALRMGADENFPYQRFIGHRRPIPTTSTNHYGSQGTSDACGEGEGEDCGDRGTTCDS